MPEQSQEWIKFVFTGALGALGTAYGFTQSMMSKASCNAKQGACIKTVDTKLDNMASDISEIKGHLEKIVSDFYKPRV